MFLITVLGVMQEMSINYSLSVHWMQLSLLLRPFWLPREFAAVITLVVYIPLSRDTDKALWEVHRTISDTERKHREAAFIVAGDFNQASLCVKYYHGTSTVYRCLHTREQNNKQQHFRDLYKPLLCPQFGKSDHSFVLLLPTYRQKLKQAPPTFKEIQMWSDQQDEALRDCFGHMEWETFHDSADNNIDVENGSSHGLHSEMHP